MKKLAIAMGLILMASPAFAAVTVSTQPTSLVTSPLTVGASSTPVSLFSFALSADAAESLSSVAVTVNAVSGSTVTGSHMANLAVYRDANANNTFDSSLDTQIGSQSTVNIGSPTVVSVTASSLTGGARFFVTMSTSSSWTGVAPADSVTATLGTAGIVTSAISPTVTAATTSTITAPAPAAPTLSSAVASNASGTASIAFTFNAATNAPVISSSNINSVLALNNSHSWLDGSGNIGSTTWSSGNTVLTVNLSSTTTAPTIAVGDTVTVSGSTIKDATGTTAASGVAAITGSLVQTVVPSLSTAIMSSNNSTVALNFSSSTNSPVVSSSNINSVLALNNSHSWLDGSASIGSATWSNTGKTLTVMLSSATSAPTVAVGDMVTVSGSVIKNLNATSNATGSATITAATTSGNGEGDDDDGEGMACGTSIVNGHLYKVADSPTVYLAAHCILRPFRGEAVFHARGNKFKNITILQVLPVASVSTTPALPASGTLVKGSDKTVWFIESGEKRKGFANEAAFLGLGFNFGQVSQIADTDLATMNVDTTPINTAAVHPDGALVKCTNSSTILQISGGVGTGFANETSFEIRGHTFQQVAAIDCGKYHYVIGATLNQ